MGEAVDNSYAARHRRSTTRSLRRMLLKLAEVVT